MVVFMNFDKASDDYCYTVARMNIKKYRKQLGITSQELADRSGLTYQYLKNLQSEKAVVRPRLDSLSRIAKALKINLRQLFDDLEEN